VIPRVERIRARARVIAFYLPQFHPIPENDVWWGPGFTEWTNVARARPLYRGHVQPQLPADLGFCDLRIPEVRTNQAKLASQHGIEGFCYWHYWFAGRRLLERPFEEVLSTGSPDFPFMLGWANQSWTGVWHGDPDRVLIEQTYPGMGDHERHFRYLLGAFSDPRYLLVDGKPAFYVQRPREIPDVVEMTDAWRRLAERAGLRGLYLIAEAKQHVDGFDAIVPVNLPGQFPGGLVARLRRRFRRGLTVYDYGRVLPRLVTDAVREVNVHPCLIPNWDNTPRSGHRGIVLAGSTPELFQLQVRTTNHLVAEKPPEHRLIFVKSWNEWAEGNYLEPDMNHGTKYLEALAAEVLVSDEEGTAQAPVQVENQESRAAGRT
jgi:lipopolysaccharide biosynthesis protein